MTILTRYVLRNVLFVFLLTLFLLSLGLGGYLVSVLVVQHFLPVAAALKIVPCILPEVFTITVPITFLLACTLFFSKMTFANEIIALKSMGIPVWRIFSGVWILAVILSVGSVFCNDIAYSWGRRAITRVLVNGMEQTIMNKLKMDGKFEPKFQDLIMSTDYVTEDNTLIRPQLTNRKAEFRVTAKKAKLNINLDSEVPRVEITLDGAFIEHEQGKIVFQNIYTYSYDIADLSSVGQKSEPRMSRVKESLTKLNSDRARVDRELAINAAFSLVAGNFSEFSEYRWVDRHNKTNEFKKKENRLLLRNPRCWASGFTCFFFAWVGIPLAVLLGYKDQLLRAIFCFLVVLIIYYPFFSLGIEGGKNGFLPPQCIWLGNALLGIVGFALLKKISRH